jgi:hypothetical protein
MGNRRKIEGGLLVVIPPSCASFVAIPVTGDGPPNYRFDECSCPAQPSIAPSGELFSLSDVVATAKETNHG